MSAEDRTAHADLYQNFNFAFHKIDHNDGWVIDVYVRTKIYWTCMSEREWRFLVSETILEDLIHTQNYLSNYFLISLYSSQSSFLTAEGS